MISEENDLQVVDVTYLIMLVYAGLRRLSQSKLHCGWIGATESTAFFLPADSFACSSTVYQSYVRELLAHHPLACFKAHSRVCLKVDD